MLVSGSTLECNAMTFKMDFIKKRLCPQRRKNEENKKQQISWPLERPSYKEQTRPNSGPRGDACTVPMDFIPRTRGEEATRAFMDSGMSDDLIRLLDDRDRAERQVAEGPKTIGTKEVQLIIREPTARSVEIFHQVRRHSEITVKYGTAGNCAFQIGKCLCRNGTPRLPPLQLKDFGTTMKEHKEFSNSLSIPPTPSTPIDWLGLRASRALNNDSRPSSIVTVPGGWRDSLYPSQHNDPEIDSSGHSSVTSDINEDEDEAEEEWEIQEVQQATVLTMTRIPTSEIHKAHITSRKDRT